jgi:sugar phosphate isomerase/epimerase
MRFGPDDLILSQYSLRDVDFDERVGVAADAGFAAIGLAAGEFLRLRDRGWTDDRLVQTLDRHGLVVDEIEALRLDGSRRNEDVMWHMADLFGASHVHVLGPYSGDLAAGVDELDRIADAGREHGVRVAIEFFPPTNVPDVATASEMVVASRRDIGLCVDTWHHFRGAHDWVALGALAPDQVVSIQINDGAAEPTVPDYLEDTLSNRLPPGEGDFDLVRFVRTLDSIGVVAPYSVEVMSATPAAPDPGALATLLADRTRRVLAEARNRAAG